ncbi:hypothetical protein EN942_34865, partial [Mesorhizobium sp. M7A.F.Ca.CA.001.14.1.1]
MLQGKNILGLKQISTGAILPLRTADNGRSAVLPSPADVHPFGRASPSRRDGQHEASSEQDLRIHHIQPRRIAHWPGSRRESGDMLGPSAHIDTFTRDHLPPPEQWPDILLD